MATDPEISCPPNRTELSAQPDFSRPLAKITTRHGGQLSDAEKGLGFGCR